MLKKARKSYPQNEVVRRVDAHLEQQNLKIALPNRNKDADFNSKKGSLIRSKTCQHSSWVDHRGPKTLLAYSSKTEMLHSYSTIGDKNLEWLL